MKNIKFIFVITIIAISSFGFKQLTSNNMLLYEITAMCCNNGLCDGSPCQNSSTILLSGGGEYETDCYECIEWVHEGTVYDYYGPNPSYCTQNDGGRYYGDHTEYQITFGDPGAGFEGYNLDGNGYATSPGSYWLTAGQHSLVVKKFTSEGHGDREFVQWNDGVTSCSRTITVSGSATYYPIYQ